MPTDLTGAPTSLGIGTYNVDVDAPSGLGFNAAMAQIDAIIAARIASTPSLGDAMVYNGTAWVKSSTLTTQRLNYGGSNLPKISVSALSGGPPASPVDGDIWIATGVDGNGTRWQFQYNAGSASPYKWEFIGGGDLVVASNANAAVNAGGGNVMNGPTLARAGDYEIGYGSLLQNNFSGSNPVVLVVSTSSGGAAITGFDGIQTRLNNSGLPTDFLPGWSQDVATALAANTQLFLSATTVTNSSILFARNKIVVRPRRIS